VPKIAVLGSTGMLGRELVRTKFIGYEVVELNRVDKPVINSNHHVRVDSKLTNLENALDLSEIQYLVNCAGLIRQKIDESNSKSVAEASVANIDIPRKLISLSKLYNFKIIQIGTDCVYSGSRGNYIESDYHDATDIYGKTKSLGEISHKNLSIIRTSIIGKEEETNKSLLSWLLSQPQGAGVKGFSDQVWNGVTVRHFSKFVAGIIASKNFELFSGVHHVVPADKVTKEQLLRYFTSAFNRQDIQVVQTSSGHQLDMTLSTNNIPFNEALWKLAGYNRPLSIQEMIIEYSLDIELGG